MNEYEVTLQTKRIDGRIGSGATRKGSILQGSTPSPVRFCIIISNDVGLQGSSFDISESAVALGKAKANNMLALPSMQNYKVD